MIKRTLDILIDEILKIVISFCASAIVGLLLVEMAAAERGYSGAFGGEWILIIGIYAITYYFLSE